MNALKWNKKYCNICQKFNEKRRVGFESCKSWYIHDCWSCGVIVCKSCQPLYKYKDKFGNCLSCIMNSIKNNDNHESMFKQQKFMIKMWKSSKRTGLHYFHNDILRVVLSFL